MGQMSNDNSKIKGEYMIGNLWFFLSVMAIAGVIFAMFAFYLDHQKKIKILEIEAATDKKESSISHAE